MNIDNLKESIDPLINNLIQSMHSPAILLIDFQWDFISGSLAVPKAIELLESVQLFLDHIESKFSIPIIATADSHPETSETFSINIYDKLISLGYTPTFLQADPTKKSTENININTIIEWAKENNPDSIFLTWPTHCVTGTEGAKLAIKKSVNHIYLTKGHDIEEYSIVGSFESSLNPIKRFNQEFIETTKHIDTFLVCGLATDFCVKETMFDLIKLGKNVVFIAELSKGIMPNATELVCEQLEHVTKTNSTHGKFIALL